MFISQIFFVWNNSKYEKSLSCFSEFSFFNDSKKMLYNDTDSEVDAKIPRGIPVLWNIKRGMNTLYVSRAENVASSSTVVILRNCSDLTIKLK